MANLVRSIPRRTSIFLRSSVSSSTASLSSYTGPSSTDGRGYDHGAIDVHTHCYLPRYMEMLRSRTDVPYVCPGKSGADDERYVILPGEDAEDTTATWGRKLGTWTDTGST
jgi:hypothetical protein